MTNQVSRDCPPHFDIKESGIIIETIKSGDERYFPSPNSIVRVHYEVFQSKEPQHDTEPLDSSREREKPIHFTLGTGEAIHGLDIAVFNMCLGMIAEVTIPSSFAFGSAGFNPHVPPNTDLKYRIELLDFTDEGPPI